MVTEEQFNVLSNDVLKLTNDNLVLKAIVGELEKQVKGLKLREHNRGEY